MPDLDVDFALIDQISARLDLREPNAQALRSLAAFTSDHYDVKGLEPPFEGVADVATGVGKTYVMAGAIEYYAARGHRNFAVITPGSTILNKTIKNFSLGSEKSLLPGMSFQPEVITADDFDSPRIAFEMENPDEVKLYIFTVQSLIRPTSNAARRTHEFREGLGEAFYEKLAAEPGLIVFADEHHTYYGSAFSRAVRGLDPYALFGLTATPHPDTPQDQIVYRYPLAAAIADRFVKTPVIVGRRDELTDDRTKLADGVRLLEYKRKAVSRYVASEGLDPINPVMLVVAQNIADADTYTEILERKDFFGGRYQGHVLTIHSDQPDAALAALEKVEDPGSPVRVIVSVGMLKEGWDVKNVYVIASMRASVSEILTEQTLGRGLRLPFGAYTDIEMLDTLEVVAHERYSDLLKKADVLQEDLVDYRRLLVMHGGDGSLGRPSLENVEVRPHVRVEGGDGPDGGSSGGDEEGQPSSTGGGLEISSLEERTKDVGEQTEQLAQVVKRRPGRPEVHIPVVRMESVKARLSLADIDPSVFRALGERHAANPEDELLRTVISAKRTKGDGDSVELVTGAAHDAVEATSSEQPLEQSRALLRKRVAAAPEVPARADQVGYLSDLVDAYIEGLGESAAAILSAYLERAVRSFRMELRQAQREFEAKPEFGEVISYESLPEERVSRSKVSHDLAGKFSKGVGYEGWNRSFFTQAWFDSEPEFRFAGIADASKEIEFWIRLQRGDIQITYSSSGQRYNPDFLVVLTDGTHILVEIKAQNAVDSDTVQAKKEAAGRWVRRVSKAKEQDWEYWILTDEDLDDSGGSWSVLTGLAR